MTPFFWLRWIRRLLTAVLLVAVLGFGYVAARVWWVGRQDAAPRSDVIVVLGASQYDGRPSPVFKARLDHALALYRRDVAPRVVTVGYKQPGDRFTEADAGADYLAGQGVPRRALVVVPQGTDTLGSLRAVDGVISTRGWSSVVLVTDPWHVLRARAMARDLGLSAQASPVRTGPSVDGLGTELRYIGRESLAYVYYRVFRNDAVHGTGAV